MDGSVYDMMAVWMEVYMIMEGSVYDVMVVWMVVYII